MLSSTQPAIAIYDVALKRELVMHCHFPMRRRYSRYLSVLRITTTFTSFFSDKTEVRLTKISLYVLNLLKIQKFIIDLKQNFVLKKD